jgi:hypothetical protein
MPQTLDFVRDCGERWNVPIVWVEYAPDGEKQRKFRVVDHRTASRQGEPYEALLRERRYLPNPVTRFCTTQLLCGRSHNISNLASLLMWPPAGRCRGFSPASILGAT